MVILPIEKKLKKRMHKTLALAQDILVMEIYNSFPSAIIHGGTAVWRCYGSNRFSEDVDVYLPSTTKGSDVEKFLDNLKRKDFLIEKFKKTENAIFAKFSYLNVIVRFESVFKNIKNFETKQFEMSDGTSIIVNTLRPEEMIGEKVSAYFKRKKVRDLYDIFFLLKFVEDEEKIKNDLVKLVKGFKRPVDERDLRVLIISGSIPNVESILEVIRGWAR